MANVESDSYIFIISRNKTTPTSLKNDLDEQSSPQLGLREVIKQPNTIIKYDITLTY